MRTIPISDLFDIIGSHKKATKNNISTSCPFCGKPNHFFINTITQAWDCKKCGRDGNIYMLLKELGKTYLLQGAIVDTQKKLLTLADYFEQEHQEEETEIPDKKLPIGFTKLKYDDDNEYAIYLRKRKFTQIDFDLYYPGYTDIKVRYENYVLIPIERDFSLKGFMGRYIQNADADGKRRYENSKETMFSHLLFGYDEIEFDTQSLILVEGGFDKVSVTTELNLHNEKEFKCNATFGKKISAEQIKLMKKTRIKNIFLMYDAEDAIKTMKHKAFELERAGFRVFVCLLQGNDPGDSKATELLQALETAKKPSEFWLGTLNKIKLKG